MEFHCVEFAAVRLCEALSLCSIMECKARNPQSFAHLHREIGPKIVVERNTTGPFLCPSSAGQNLEVPLVQLNNGLLFLYCTLTASVLLVLLSYNDVIFCV